MTQQIALDSCVSDVDATWEIIDAICEELGLDAHNSLSREIVTHEVIECARLERDPERICEMVVAGLKGPSRLD
jgi:hypothetical protein